MAKAGIFDADTGEAWSETPLRFASETDGAYFARLCRYAVRVLAEVSDPGAEYEDWHVAEVTCLEEAQIVVCGAGGPMFLRRRPAWPCTSRRGSWAARGVARRRRRRQYR